MARDKPPGGPEDARVTDLARYRRARAQARKAPSRPRPPASASFLGSRPRAGLILIVVVVLLAATWALPKFL
jgi:hypothetical protein